MMSDVLDQSEVDALLSAIGGGGDGPLSDTPARAGMGGTLAAPPRNVSDYDFKRPERVGKDQMRALEGLHENFSRNFGASISSFLRSIIEVSVAGVEQLTFSEFIYSLPNPTCFNLLKAEPLKGNMCLEISPLIIYPIIDRLLGGTSDELFVPQRPLTDIELRLVERILDRALSALTESWRNLGPVQFELTEMESNPHLVQIVAPAETVVIVGFEIKSGQRTGTMSLCIPFNVIEPVIGKLGAQSWLTQDVPTDCDAIRTQVIHNIRLSKLRIRSFLGQTKITMDDLLKLQVGDVVQLGKRASAECIVQIEGKNKFASTLGQYRGNKAVRLTRSAQPDEPL